MIYLRFSYGLQSRIVSDVRRREQVGKAHSKNSERNKEIWSL